MSLYFFWTLENQKMFDRHYGIVLQIFKANLHQRKVIVGICQTGSDENSTLYLSKEWKTWYLGLTFMKKQIFKNVPKRKVRFLMGDNWWFSTLDINYSKNFSRNETKNGQLSLQLLFYRKYFFCILKTILSTTFSLPKSKGCILPQYRRIDHKHFRFYQQALISFSND